MFCLYIKFVSVIHEALQFQYFLFQIISDIDLKAPSVKLVQLLALHPNVTVYMYEFDYSSKDDVIVTKYGSSKNLWVGKSQKNPIHYFYIYFLLLTPPFLN